MCEYSTFSQKRNLLVRYHHSPQCTPPPRQTLLHSKLTEILTSPEAMRRPLVELLNSQLVPEVELPAIESVRPESAEAWLSRQTVEQRDMR